MRQVYTNVSVQTCRLISEKRKVNGKEEKRRRGSINLALTAERAVLSWQRLG